MNKYMFQSGKMTQKLLVLFLLSHILSAYTQIFAQTIIHNSNNGGQAAINYVENPGCKTIDIYPNTVPAITNSLIPPSLVSESPNIIKFPANFDVYKINRPYVCKWNFWTTNKNESQLKISENGDNLTTTRKRIRIRFVKYRMDLRCTTHRNLDYNYKAYYDNNQTYNMAGTNFSSCSIFPFYTKKYPLDVINRILIRDLTSKSSSIAQKEVENVNGNSLGCLCGVDEQYRNELPNDNSLAGYTDPNWYIDSAHNTQTLGISLSFFVPRPQIGLSFELEYEYLPEEMVCGGSIISGKSTDNTVINKGGLITSPNYPESIITSGVQCLWVLSFSDTTHDKKHSRSFASENEQKNDMKSRFFLNITFGNGEIKRLEKNYVGNMARLVMVGSDGSSRVIASNSRLKSTSDTITIKYIVKPQISDSGFKKAQIMPFKIRWSPYYEISNAQGLPKCPNGMFSCDATNGTSSAQFVDNDSIICLPVELACNGFVECPFSSLDENPKFCAHLKSDNNIIVASSLEKSKVKTFNGSPSSPTPAIGKEVSQTTKLISSTEETMSNHILDPNFRIISNAQSNNVSSNGKLIKINPVDSIKSNVINNNGVESMEIRNHKNIVSHQNFLWMCFGPVLALVILIPMLYLALRKCNRKDRYDVKYYNTSYVKDYTANKSEKNGHINNSHASNGISNNGDHKNTNGSVKSKNCNTQKKLLLSSPKNYAVNGKPFYANGLISRSENTSFIVDNPQHCNGHMSQEPLLLHQSASTHKTRSDQNLPLDMDDSLKTNIESNHTNSSELENGNQNTFLDNPFGNGGMPNDGVKNGERHKKIINLRAEATSEDDSLLNESLLESTQNIDLKNVKTTNGTITHNTLYNTNNNKNHHHKNKYVPISSTTRSQPTPI